MRIPHTARSTFSVPGILRTFSVPGVLRVVLLKWMILRVLAPITMANGSVTQNQKYLDRDLYSLNSDTQRKNQNLEDEFHSRFPPPPLFPPPPPSVGDDMDYLLRQMVFNLDKEKGDTKGGDSLVISDESSESGQKGDPHLGLLCPSFLNPPAWVPVGPKGSRGVQGPKGRIGLPGHPGPEGPPGIAGRHGRRGKRGIQGPEGPAGVTGSPGIQGPKGESGNPGADGSDGKRGYPGPRGVTGDPGRNGGPGIPGLVIFSDSNSMHQVSLEGLLAYRSDVKQLYFRDHVTWRAIRVTQCGDGIVDRDMGEECDDGNDDVNDSCVRCRRARCGDRVIQKGREECDTSEFNGKSCSLWRRGTTGKLLCTRHCRISYRKCHYVIR